MYTVYSKPNCPQCVQAKSLILSKGHEYKEIIIDVGQDKEDNKEYISLSDLKKLIPGAKSAPQIYYQDKLVGDFMALKVSLY